MVAPAGADKLLEGLTAAQRAAVVSDAAPLCIVAGAGAGKTRVLTRRVAFRCRTGAADPGHTLALTFTRKAAGELRRRLAGLGVPGPVAAGTFHAHASAQLQRWWADRRQPAPARLDRKSRLLGPIVAERATLSAPLAALPLAEVAAVIEWAKARVIGPEELEAELASGHGGRRPLAPGVSPAVLAAVYARYEHEKRRRGLVDFDDLLARCAEAMERDPEFAGAQRWRWRHVYVDEFQDLNPLQHRLLLAWLGPSVDLCVVGDPNQAIYGWNGADPGLLRSLPDRWPTAQVIRLDENHRCRHAIVRAAAAVLGSEGDGLRGVDRPGPPPAVHHFESDGAEAQGVAAALAAAHREGRAWSAMAVLTRTNGQLGRLEEALSAVGAPVWSTAPEDDGAERGSLSVDAVTLSTFHRAKGLEWDLVWVAGAEEGLVPMGRAEPGSPATEEERRLLYVALTRAADEVHVSWAATRSFGAGPVPRRPSRWLEAVAAVTESMAQSMSQSMSPPAGPRDVRAADRLAAARAALRDSAERAGRPARRRTPREWPEPDDHLRQALRAWRLDAARSSGVPPHVLLHDVTVEALAALRPATMDELLAIPGFGAVKAARYGPVLLDIVGVRARTA